MSVIAMIIEAVQPADVDGLALLASLMTEQRTPGELVALEARLERAVKELDDLAGRSREVRERCQRLQPSPAPTAPAGF